MSVNIAIRNILCYVLKRYELNNLTPPIFTSVYQPIYKEMFHHYLKSDTDIGIFIYPNSENIGIQLFNQMLITLHSAVHDLKKVIILYNKCTSECKKIKKIPTTDIDLELYNITKLQINVLQHNQYIINIKKLNDTEKEQFNRYYGKASLKTQKLTDPISYYLKFSKDDIISYTTQTGDQDYRLVEP
jgi:hypothetical protein